MKLYLSASIVDTSMPSGKLSGVSFNSKTTQTEKTTDMTFYYTDGCMFEFSSSDLEADKKALTKYFKNLEKQESEK